MRATGLTARAAAILLLGGCAGGAFAPSAVPPAGTPYAGLHEGSYGPRSATRFRLCEASAGSDHLATLASAATLPARGLMKIDATLQRLDLARHFTDPLGADHPPVAVLSHLPDSIVFWHSVRSVPLAEVAQAAKAYCDQRQRGTLYRGSATRCPASDLGLTGAPVVQTFAISAYACTGRP